MSPKPNSILKEKIKKELEEASKDTLFLKDIEETQDSFKSADFGEHINMTHRSNS